MEQVTNPDSSKQKTVQPHTNHRIHYIALIALAVIIGVGGFVGGIQYQKMAGTSRVGNMNNNRDERGGMPGNGRMNRNGSFGAVTAVSATSISVKDQRANTTKTYTVDSSTTINSAGKTTAIGDIAVGDTVIVQTSSSASTTATSISVNPSMGGGPDGESNDSITN